ncbi:response regulator transcription factor [Brotaphodocola sp.]|uniref:response regulator transcription factor n=1 Tax=Brotaphodocola sp. TaxID=3073577 RepID=UPI003D7CF918
MGKMGKAEEMGKYRLLIADDEPIERAVLTKVLKKNLGDCCEIYQAGNGREAIRAWQENQIQVALLDIEMPGINGIQAAEQIRQEDKNCKIIFLTAFDEFSYAKSAIRVQALDYLLKPYREEELLLVLEEAFQQVQESVKTVEERQTEAERESEPAVSDEKEQGNAQEDEREEPIADEIHLNFVKKRIAQYIQDHYCEELLMQDVAREMNYSEAYFCKLFKQCFQMNFTAYLTEQRIGEAKRLLEDPMVNIKKISQMAGYADANYFAKVFKRMTSHTPSEYRTMILQSMK